MRNIASEIIYLINQTPETHFTLGGDLDSVRSHLSLKYEIFLSTNTFFQMV